MIIGDRAPTPRPHLPHQATRPREALVPLLALVVTVAVPLALRDRLPDVVAIHWGLDGRPDGSAPLVLDVLLLALLVGLVVALPLRLAGRAPRSTARQLVATSHALGVLLAGVRWLTVAANLDVADWQDAARVTGLDLLGLVPLALLAGVVGWWVARDRPERPSSVQRVAAAPSTDGEVVVWIGRQSVGWAMRVAPAAAAAGVLAIALGRTVDATVVGGVLVLVGLLLSTLTSIAVTVGPAGVVVRLGPFGLPGIDVPLGDVADVVVEDVEPLVYGGWGYRILPGVRALVIRRGPGLRITRVARPDLVITVDDAAGAAAVLMAHLTHDDGPGRASSGR